MLKLIRHKQNQKEVDLSELTAVRPSQENVSLVRKKLFGVDYAITDYNAASSLIISKALAFESYGVSALAVHGLVESTKNKNFRAKLQKIQLIVPDGQPIKWSLNHFQQAGLKERVAGPILTQYVMKKASELGLRIYLYGSTAATLEKMQRFIFLTYPGINICGVHADRFREATPEEDLADIEKIKACKPHLVLVGRGCPRQEIWVSDHLGRIDAPMMAIGAAFDFMAGNIKQAPVWMQHAGLEWFYRLIQEPQKLWKRYLITNSHFLLLFIRHKLGFRNTNP